MSIIWLFIILFTLIFLEVPILIAMPLSSFVYMLGDGGLPFYLVAGRIASGLESFVLLAVPLFILAGNLLNSSGVAHRIFVFAQKTVGHIDGGLAHVNVVSSIVFAGMSGVAQADAAGLGAIEIKQMRKVGFTPEFSAAITAASSIIGPIIPPSCMMVIYAVLADTSVPELFLAGVVPGVLMGLFLMGTIWVLVKTNKVYAPKEPKVPFKEIVIAFKDAFPSLMAPILLLAGLFLGIATPTELGAIICVYAIILGFIYKEMTVKALLKSVYNTVVTCGILTSIMAMAVPFSGILAIKRVPQELAEVLMSFGGETWVVLLILNVALLFLGCIMESTAILLVTVPVLVPLMGSLGVSPTHLGIIMVINLLLGTITPPFGVLLFVMMDVAKVKFKPLLKAILPFYIPLFIFLLLITYFSGISMALPNYIFK